MHPIVANAILMGLALGAADATLAALSGFRVPASILLAVVAGDLVLASIAGAVARLLTRRLRGGAAAHARATLVLVGCGLALEEMLHEGLRREQLLGWSGAILVLASLVVTGAGLLAIAGRPARASRPVPACLAWTLALVLVLTVPLGADWLGQSLPRPILVACGALGMAAATIVAAVLVPAPVAPVGARTLAGLLAAACAVPCVLGGLFASDRLALPAMGSAAGTAARARALPLPAEQPNVLLLSLDTLRDDHVGPRADEACSLTPAIDRLAHEGTRYPLATSPASWTLPAQASLLTGVLPGRHGALRDTERLQPGAATLAEALRAAGYRTVALTGGGYVSRAHGLDRGFDDFDDLAEYRFFFVHEPLVIRLLGRLRWRPLQSSLEIHGGFRPMVDRVTTWLEHQPVEPFFLFLHTYEVHNYFHAYEWIDPLLVRRGRLDPRSPVLRERLAPVFQRRLGVRGFAGFDELYRAEVSWVDAQVGRLLESLARSGLDRRTIVILVSDHGEGFDLAGDRIYHGGRFHEDLIRVPMVVRLPLGPQLEAWPQPVSLVDVMPTVLDLTGLPQGDVDGLSLCRPLPPDRACFGEEAYVYDSSHPLGKRPLPGGELMDYVRTAMRKMIRAPGRRECYDLASDPGERHDLAAPRDGGDDAFTRDLESRLETLARSRAGAVPAEDAPRTRGELERLKQLGYAK